MVECIFLYLFLIAALMEFDIRKLIDVRQILLVILGMVILYVPNYIEQEHKTIRPENLGGNALWASVLQTFILLFILLSQTETRYSQKYWIFMKIRSNKHN